MCPKESCSPWRAHAGAGFSWRTAAHREYLHRSRGKVGEGRSSREEALLCTDCNPLHTPCTLQEGRRVRTWTWERGEERCWFNACLRFSLPESILTGNTLSYFSLAETFLPMMAIVKWLLSELRTLKSLSRLKGFLILFSPPILLRRGSEGVAGWVSGPWPRLIYHTPFFHTDLLLTLYVKPSCVTGRCLVHQYGHPFLQLPFHLVL